MATFLDLKTKVASEIHRTDLTSQVSDAIKSAVRYYDSQRFWFNESSGTFSTVANQVEYGAGTVPNGIVEIDLVTLTVNSRIQELSPKPWQELAAVDQTSWAGIPYYYGWRAKSLRLYPRPNAVYTCSVYFLLALPELSADADDTVWTNEGADIIRHRAKAEIFDSVLYAPQMADRCRLQENETFSRMIKRTNEMAATNVLQGDW